MANEIRTIVYVFVILSYFVRQGDPFGEQNTNAGHFRLKIVFCSPLRRPGEQNTNDFRTILFLIFFCSPNKCLGDHFTNGIRNISTFGTPSFFCSFFGAPWRLNGEWNTNNFLYLRNTVVFCSPGRPIWRTIYECGALSHRSCFLFATEAPWRTNYEWFPNNSIFELFWFAKQVPGRPFYEWNPKHIHLRHTFDFLFGFCAH